MAEVMKRQKKPYRQHNYRQQVRCIMVKELSKKLTPHRKGPQHAPTIGQGRKRCRYRRVGTFNDENIHTLATLKIKFL